MSDSNKRGYLADITFGIFVIGALVSCVIYFLNYQKQNTDEYESASKNYKANVTQGSDICSAIDRGELSNDRLTCLAQARVAESDAETAIQDLKAQQQMAEWSLGVLLFSGLSFLVTGIGVIYLRWTLVQGNSINQQAIHTNTIIQNEQRPWLKISLVRHGNIKAIKADNQLIRQMHVTFEIENVGKTVANSVSFKLEMLDGRHIFNGKDQIRERIKKFLAEKNDGTSLFPSQNMPLENHLSINEGEISRFPNLQKADIMLIGIFVIAKYKWADSPDLWSYSSRPRTHNGAPTGELRRGLCRP